MEYRDPQLDKGASDDRADPWAAALSPPGGQPFFYATPLPQDDRLTLELVDAGQGDPSTRTGPLFMVDQRILAELEAIHSRLLATRRIVPFPAPDDGPERTAVPREVPSSIAATGPSPRLDRAALFRSPAVDLTFAALALILGGVAVLWGGVQIIGGVLGATPLLSRLLGLDVPVNEAVLGVPVVLMGLVSLWASRLTPSVDGLLAAIRERLPGAVEDTSPT